MNHPMKNAMIVTALSGSLLMLNACGGGGGGTQTASNQGQSMVAQAFAFPATNGQTDAQSITIPSTVTPSFSARRKVQSGSGGRVDFGDPVVIKYSMYSWRTGQLVETSDSLDEPVTVRAGIDEAVPSFLSKSLLGRNIGDTLQLVYEEGMEDLPDYLDNTDAYVVMVKLI